jgi:hypothetical protein
MDWMIWNARARVENILDLAPAPVQKDFLRARAVEIQNSHLHLPRSSVQEGAMFALKEL